MKLTSLWTLRRMQHQVFRQIVEEWEDDFAAELGLPLRDVSGCEKRANGRFGVLRRRFPAVVLPWDDGGRVTSPRGWNCALALLIWPPGHGCGGPIRAGAARPAPAGTVRRVGVSHHGQVHGVGDGARACQGLAFLAAVRPRPGGRVVNVRAFIKSRFTRRGVWVARKTSVLHELHRFSRGKRRLSLMRRAHSRGNVNFVLRPRRLHAERTFL